LIAGGAASVILVLVALHKPSQSVRLKDGTVLTLEEVKFGATNTFFIGSRLERIFWRVIPKGGFHFGRLNLQQPSKETFADPRGEILALLFKVSGTDVLKVQHDVSLLITAEGGHEYEVSIFPTVGRTFGRNQFLFSLVSAFPRDERLLRVRVRDRKERTHSILGQFVVRNPVPPQSSSGWKTESSPILRRFGDLQLTLGDITAEKRFPVSPGETSTLPIRVLNRQTVETNWLLHSILLRDNLGNFCSSWSFKEVHGEWLRHALSGLLDPKNVWKVEAHLARDADFSPDQLFTFDLTIPFTASISTNHLGVPVTIAFVNTDMLAVEIPTNLTDLRLSFVTARNQSGQEIHDSSGNWNQHRFWRQLRLPSQGGRITATVAIHPDYPFECIVQPRTIR